MCRDHEPIVDRKRPTTEHFGHYPCPVCPRYEEARSHIERDFYKRFYAAISTHIVPPQLHLVTFPRGGKPRRILVSFSL